MALLLTLFTKSPVVFDLKAESFLDSKKELSDQEIVNLQINLSGNKKATLVNTSVALSLFLVVFDF